MEYFTVLTNKGIEKIAQATANKTTLDLSHIAVGDGNGTVPTPEVSQTQLINEVFRTNLSELKIDENNSNHIVLRSIIPTQEGNFWIREVGIYDSEGDLIAVGNYPETYKSVLEEGAPKEVNLTVILEVSNTQVMNLVIDSSVTLASQEFVNEKLLQKAEKIHEHDTKYALINGNQENTFKVRNAEADYDAVNKRQMEDSIIAQSASGTFAARIWGRIGNTETGTLWEKEVEGNYQKIGNRVFIHFGRILDGTDYSDASFRGIENLPFRAKQQSAGTLFARGIQWRYLDSLSSAPFLTGVFIDANSNGINIKLERTDTPYSGYPAFRRNDSGCILFYVSISYEIKE